MQEPGRILTRRQWMAGATASAAGLTLPYTSRAAGAATPPQPLRAGAARRNITPPLGLSFNAPIMQVSPARHIHDELFARALALDDGTTRLAIVICDCTVISREVCDRAKRLVREQTGLPAESVVMAATHSHMAPRCVAPATNEAFEKYLDFLARETAGAVVDAIRNLAPARIGWGTGSKPELAVNRRWRMKPGSVPPNPFGGTSDRVLMGGYRSPDRIEPAGLIDPEVSVVSVQHSDGRPLALLANFSIHYAGFKDGEVSADYFGDFCKRVEQAMKTGEGRPPFVGILSNGTSGDVNAVVPGKAPCFEAIEAVGSAVAGEALRVARQIEYRERVSLAARWSELELTVRRPDAQRLEWARPIWAKAKGKERFTRPEVYAREAIYLEKYPPQIKIPLQAMRIGELGIAAIPCEVFAETGLAIKKQSPLKPAFTIELANAYHGYLPSPRQHELGGYESWPARSSCLEVQAEPKIIERAVQLLAELAGSGR